MDDQYTGIELGLPESTASYESVVATIAKLAPLPRDKILTCIKANRKTLESICEFIGNETVELSSVRVEFHNYMPDGHYAIDMADGSTVFSNGQSSFRLQPAKFDLFVIQKV